MWDEVALCGVCSVTDVGVVRCECVMHLIAFLCVCGYSMSHMRCVCANVSMCVNLVL